jgi:hypothetical protein
MIIPAIAVIVALVAVGVIVVRQRRVTQETTVGNSRVRDATLPVSTRAQEPRSNTGSLPTPQAQKSRQVQGPSRNTRTLGTRLYDAINSPERRTQVQAQPQDLLSQLRRHSSRQTARRTRTVNASTSTSTSTSTNTTTTPQAAPTQGTATTSTQPPRSAWTLHSFVDAVSAKIDLNPATVAAWKRAPEEFIKRLVVRLGLVFPTTPTADGLMSRIYAAIETPAGRAAARAAATAATLPDVLRALTRAQYERAKVAVAHVHAALRGRGTRAHPASTPTSNAPTTQHARTSRDANTTTQDSMFQNAQASASVLQNARSQASASVFQNARSQASASVFQNARSQASSQNARSQASVYVLENARSQASTQNASSQASASVFQNARSQASAQNARSQASSQNRRPTGTLNDVRVPARARSEDSTASQNTASTRVSTIQDRASAIQDRASMRSSENAASWDGDNARNQQARRMGQTGRVNGALSTEAAGVSTQHENQAIPEQSGNARSRSQVQAMHRPNARLPAQTQTQTQTGRRRINNLAARGNARAQQVGRADELVRAQNQVLAPIIQSRWNSASNSGQTTQPRTRRWTQAQ